MWEKRLKSSVNLTLLSMLCSLANKIYDTKRQKKSHNFCSIGPLTQTLGLVEMSFLILLKKNNENLGLLNMCYNLLATRKKKQKNKRERKEKDIESYIFSQFTFVSLLKLELLRRVRDYLEIFLCFVISSYSA